MPAEPRAGPGTFRGRGRSRWNGNCPTRPALTQPGRGSPTFPGVSFSRSHELRSGAEPPPVPAMPTETERCIESLLAVFQRYAGREGDACTLSKREFRAFMDTELAAFTKNQKDPGVVDRMMKKLDMNSDGQLDFQEFLNLIGGIAVACHDSLVLKAPKP
ncbi:protein S100-A11-like [Melozone crissalis]|uniref:protein S100-A11-like n=1 Tax=Melozone crissalis TaxID=40204 RepID=UPI0023D9E261|nr:protein S100-A11-like [Melozone crissalis]